MKYCFLIAAAGATACAAFQPACCTSKISACRRRDGTGIIHGIRKDGTIRPPSSLGMMTSFDALSSIQTLVAAADLPPSPAATLSFDEFLGGHAADVAVFVVGLIPFAWATVEFWRRIAVGESFGTGSDSVVIIGEDGAPQSSRGRRVLGMGALAAAYVLFTVAALSIAIAVFSVVMSPEVGMDAVGAGVASSSL